MTLELKEAEYNSCLVISIFGEVDMGSSPQLRTKIIRSVNEGHVNLILDLTSVDFLDSAGLGTIIGALRRVRSQNGCLLYTSPSPRDLSTSRMPSSA